ncbi:MAG TPA: hypothetical protein VFY26_05225 [Anaerolineales bacterium]|nr:hypothetical protein [Anaerolineales bacterium]
MIGGFGGGISASGLVGADFLSPGARRTGGPSRRVRHACRRRLAVEQKTASRHGIPEHG